MSRIFTSFLISQVAIALGVAGCAFKEDTGPAKPEMKPADVIEALEKGREEQAKNLKLAEGEVKLEFLEGSPGFYLARLSWPERITQAQVTKANDGRPILISDKSEYTEVVASGQKVSFGLAIKDAMGLVLYSSNFEGSAPKDLQIGDIRSLEKNTDYDDYRRIFFYEGGKIITNGFNLTIRADKLIFANSGKGESKETFFNSAHIVTHYPDTVPTSSTRRENSKINIDADYAEGELVMMMIGLNGRDGKDGDQLAEERGLSLTEPKQALTGEPGRAGEAGVSGRPCARGIKGLDIGCEQPRPFCKSQPTSGSRGKKGDKGLDGESAEDGGDTGTAYLRVDDHRNFKVIIYTRQGKAGKPGKAGTGFAGGRGGPPGFAPEGCTPASEGPRGQIGDAGSPGKEGQDGRYGPFESSFPIAERSY